MMKWRSVLSPLLFIFLVSISFHGLVFCHAVPEENEMRLELIHRHNPQLIGKLGHGVTSNVPKTQQERIQELVLHDTIRHHRMISHKRGTRRKNRETSSIAMPMHSGADYGNGEYFVQVRVGKPSQKFVLIADTGSDLTWVYCNSRFGNGNGNTSKTHKGRLRNHRRVFHADRSSSFETIPCLSDMCKVQLANLFSLSICPTPFTPCAYDYRFVVLLLFSISSFLFFFA